MVRTREGGKRRVGKVRGNIEWRDKGAVKR